EELLLLLERGVARADVRRLPVDPLLELAERDDDVVDLRERSAQLLGALRRRAGRPGRARALAVALGVRLLLAAQATEAEDAAGTDHRQCESRTHQCVAHSDWNPNVHNRFT